MKKLTIGLMFLSSFTLTGCLEELLSSLCQRLASNDSIVTVFLTPDDYSNTIARVTYEKVLVGGNEAYVRSDCDNNFTFPNGDKKVQQGNPSTNGISFVSVLDESGSMFFKTNDVLNTTDLFKVTIEILPDCSPGSSPEFTFESSVQGEQLNWQGAVDVPPELALIEECSITGQTAILEVQDL